jgi:hypothetical protein
MLAVIPLAMPMDRPLTNVRPASAVTSSTPSMDLPGLRNGDLGGAGNVPAPATPATPNPKIAQPATPATPALPPGVTPAPSSSPNDDPCDGFNNIDARERCREDQQQFDERQFEDAHNTPEPPDFRRNH